MATYPRAATLSRSGRRETSPTAYGARCQLIIPVCSLVASSGCAIGTTRTFSPQRSPCGPNTADPSGDHFSQQYANPSPLLSARSTPATTIPLSVRSPIERPSGDHAAALPSQIAAVPRQSGVAWPLRSTMIASDVPSSCLYALILVPSGDHAGRDNDDSVPVTVARIRSS